MTISLRIGAVLATGALATTLWFRPAVPGSDAPIPATSATQESPVVGMALQPEGLHVVTAPGRYGLGPELPGSRYGVVSGHLIRFDPESRRTLSVLRREQRLMD